jgi:hypothetical protein
LLEIKQGVSLNHQEKVGSRRAWSSGIQWTETIASGRSIRELRTLNRIYGKTTWRKRKGISKIRLEDGTVRLADSTGIKGTVREGRKLKSKNSWSKKQ